MKKILIFFLFAFSTLHSLAQHRRDAVWCFGDSVLVDFNQAPPRLDYCSTRHRGTACSIANLNGDLLFYASTGYFPLWQAGYYQLGVVWNKNNQVMQNGDSLIGDGWYKEMVIVPEVANSQRYYLFHTDGTLFKKLYYSVIDLSYNAGLGKVTQKNVLVDSLPGQGITDGLTAIKHGNGRDWWVVFRPYKTDGTTDNSICRILVTPSGIGTLDRQQIGLMTSSDLIRLVFNHQANKMILINVAGLVEYYDFDRCSGLLSNLITLHNEDYNSSTFYLNFNWSAEFSPNDEVLYVSTNDLSVSYLYQYDLSAPNISNSRLLIDSLTAPGNGGDLKLAIDSKIYWKGAYYNGFTWPYPYPDSMYNQYNMNLSVINQPNQLGQACDFQKYSFYLGGHRTYLGLPNNPNYDMIAKGGSVCDTLGFPNAVDRPDLTNHISIYPNPVSNYCTVTSLVPPSKINGYGEKGAYLLVFDLLGKQLQQVEVRTGLNHSRINLESYSNGEYIVVLAIDGFNAGARKIIVQH